MHRFCLLFLTWNIFPPVFAQFCMLYEKLVKSKLYLSKITVSSVKKSTRLQKSDSTNSFLKLEFKTYLQNLILFSEQGFIKALLGHFSKFGFY